MPQLPGQSLVVVNHSLLSKDKGWPGSWKLNSLRKYNLDFTCFLTNFDPRDPMQLWLYGHFCVHTHAQGKIWKLGHKYVYTGANASALLPVYAPSIVMGPLCGRLDNGQPGSSCVHYKVQYSGHHTVKNL